MFKKIAILCGIGMLLACGGASSQVSNEVLRGQALFQAHCTNCHDNSDHMLNDIGPALFGVIGRRVGSVPDFTYSPILTAADKRGECWTESRLDTFLREPYLMYQGTGMPVHFDKESDRKAIIAYLKTRSSPGLPLHNDCQQAKPDLSVHRR